MARRRIPIKVEFGGIYFYKNSLIGVQNGTLPQRVVKINLSKDLNKLTNFEILAANNPLMDDLTLGVIEGENFFFNANSQWNLLGKNGEITAPEKLKYPIVMQIKLK